ncbi:hypothetical protein KSP39_PZI007961 [Platanthera zijinensis]|uniref:Sec39 domain-containing protein n=1 Tax=Platanthera zijinensis TaxID=2320716 RepID=A0AAP0BNT7_9ASPA
MAPEREEVEEEVIYETRQHAAGVFAPELSEQKKWNEYLRQRGSKRKRALFVFPNGEHVVVAFQNQLVILQKDDDYMEPCGAYIVLHHSHMICLLKLVWDKKKKKKVPGARLGQNQDSEQRSAAEAGISWEIDLLDGAGEKRAHCLRRRASRLHARKCPNSWRLKLGPPLHTAASGGAIDSSSPLSDQDISCSNDSLSFFTHASWMEPQGILGVIDDMGTLYLINSNGREISRRTRSELKLSTSIIDLIVLDDVNSKRSYMMSTNSYLELVFCSPQFEGLFSSTKGHLISLTSPKVSISPQGKYIAALDLTGCLDVFSIDSDANFLSIICFAERFKSFGSISSPQGRKHNLKDVIDIIWWTDHVLILANSNGSFTMYDVLSDMIVLKDGPHFCRPVLERPRHNQGHVFVLEGRSCEGEQSESKQTYREQASKNDQLCDVELHWSLLSISGKSVLEMYRILISNQQFHSALEFADCHSLDKDEVFKEQWLSSVFGAREVDLFLSKISDQMFTSVAVIQRQVGYISGDKHGKVCSILEDAKLQLLENYHAEISPGQLSKRISSPLFIIFQSSRFSSEVYSNFRFVPVTVVVNLAESGKIGALNLLFKRHPYSLSQDILHVLSAIPETIPVQSYSQLLPGKSPQTNIALRDRDWVECEHMISLIDRMPGGSEKLIQVGTENIMKLSVGIVWPSATELVDWYNSRARDIDGLSGQLENCLAFIGFACRKDITEITYLHQLIYCNGCTEDFNMGLAEWEQLPDYEKFKVLLNGVTEDSAVKKLLEKAIPFMQKRSYDVQINFLEQKNDEVVLMNYEQGDSFFVRWMKEVAAENKLDQWNLMTSILSKLPRKSLREKTLKDITPKHNLVSGTPRFSYIRSHLSKSVRHSSPLNLNSNEEDTRLRSSGGMDQLDSVATDDKLEKRIKSVEGHVEVGRLLAYYQVRNLLSTMSYLEMIISSIYTTNAVSLPSRLFLKNNA